MTSRALLSVASLSLAAVILAARPSAAAEEPHGTIPFSEVKAGMKGFGKTVFSGSKVETFDVEVLGTMVNVAPKRNIILAKLSGGPLAQTGVLEGMSGSPIYLDGRLAGAVAYAWGFAREPICGITPIDEMLDLLTREPRHEQDRSGAGGRAVPGRLSLLAYPSQASEFLKERLRRLAPAPAPEGMARARIPLMLGGAARTGESGHALQIWEDLFSSLGFTPVLAGAAAGDDNPSPGLEAGSAVGVQLVRGDVEIAAVGTVTYTKGDDVLMFGHPFFGFGPTSLPMTKVLVHGWFPSLESSFKLASTTAPAGVVTQDRFPGLRGALKGDAPVVPVKINLTSSEQKTTTYSFEIAEDPLITPVMLNLTLLEILSTAEKDLGDVTLVVKKGSKIHVADDLDVKIENLYSGTESELFAAGTVAYMTYLIMNNPDRPSKIQGIDLDLAYEDRLSLARIDRIWCDRYTVAPGGTLPLHVWVTPRRGDPFVEDIPLEVPREAPEGKAILQVGDAVTLSRMEFEAGGGASFQPTSLEQLVFLLNRIRANNRIYATVIRPDTGAFMLGERLPSLPPSISTILLSPQRDTSGTGRVNLRGVLEEDRDTEYALRGYQKTVIEIKR